MSWARTDLASSFAVFATLLPIVAAAQEGGGLDDRINEIFADYTGWYVSLIFADLPGTNFSWIALWLVVGAVVFPLCFCFIRFKGFMHSIQLVKATIPTRKTRARSATSRRSRPRSRGPWASATSPVSR